MRKNWTVARGAIHPLSLTRQVLAGNLFGDPTVPVHVPAGHDGRGLLERRRIPHRCEKFPDNHSTIDYRMDESLPFLARALSA